MKITKPAVAVILALVIGFISGWLALWSLEAEYRASLREAADDTIRIEISDDGVKFQGKPIAGGDVAELIRMSLDKVLTSGRAKSSEPLE